MAKQGGSKAGTTTGPKASDDIIDGSFTEVTDTNDGAATGATLHVQTTDAPANENVRRETPKGDAKDFTRITAYADLDDDRRADVDVIIDTIDAFDVNTILNLGESLITELEDANTKINNEQERHGGFFEQFKSVTRDCSGFEAQAGKLVDSVTGAAQSTWGLVKQHPGKALALGAGALLAGPIGAIGAVFGAGALEYAQKKKKAFDDFKNTRTIPEELKEDILRSAAERKKFEDKLKDIEKAIPLMRENYEDLIDTHIEILERIENVIIAGTEAARRIREDHLPVYAETARESGLQSDQRKAEKLARSVTLLMQKVHDFTTLRLGIINDTVTYKSRSNQIEDTEADIKSLLMSLRAAGTQLQSLKMGLSSAEMAQVINEVRQFKITLIERGTALNNTMVEMLKHGNDHIGEQTEAELKRIASTQKVLIAQENQASGRLIAMEHSQQRLLAGSAELSRLSLTQDQKALALALEAPKADGSVRTSSAKTSAPGKKDKPSLGLGKGPKP